MFSWLFKNPNWVGDSITAKTWLKRYRISVVMSLIAFLIAILIGSVAITLQH